MLQLQLFKSKKLLFRKVLYAPLGEAIDEALLEMIKFGATGAKLTLMDTTDQVIWQEGEVPEATSA